MNLQEITWEGLVRNNVAQDGDTCTVDVYTVMNFAFH